MFEYPFHVFLVFKIQFTFIGYLYRNREYKLNKMKSCGTTYRVAMQNQKALQFFLQKIILLNRGPSEPSTVQNSALAPSPGHNIFLGMYSKYDKAEIIKTVTN